MNGRQWSVGNIANHEAKMMVSVAMVGAVLFGAAAATGPMNTRPYTVANPAPGASPVRTFRGEFFEMYGNNQTSRYGDVNWHPDTVPLPDDIVARFDGKVMAITGYEVNIMRTNSATGEEEQVLATQQYNHHYTGFMHGAAAKMVEEPIDGSPSLIGTHGSKLPHWQIQGRQSALAPINGECNVSGVWLNPTNNIKVQIVPTPIPGQYFASCIGPVGWKNATIIVGKPTSTSQGTVSIAVNGSPQDNQKGVLSTFTTDCPPCSLMTWGDKSEYILEPYADRKPVKPVGIPHVQAFSEGNGNEHRNSYKGFASGFALLIQSPSTFTNNPMIINTNKLLTDDKSPGPIGGPVPRQSLAPLDADYQGILECPCTTRKIKVLDGYTLNTENKCGSIVSTPKECIEAASVVGISSALPTNSSSAPAGCSAVMQPNGKWTLQFNSDFDSSEDCGGNQSKTSPLHGNGTAGTVQVGIEINPMSLVSTLTISCASNGSWFGVGLNSSTMQGTFAVVIDGQGVVSEHQLGLHAPGTTLPATAKTVSSTFSNGVRTIVLQLPMKGSNFDFSMVDDGEFPIITAVGNTPSFSYHKVHSTGTLVVGRLGSSVCLCRDPNSNSGTIDGRKFNPGVCAAYPTSELLTTHNAICNITEYEGGLYCCMDGSILLDADQVQPEPTHTWRMKYRFYFEEYTNQSNTFRVWWSTEATNNEYDIPKSTYNCLDASTPIENCTHTIKSEFQAKDFLSLGPGCMVSGDPSACGDINRIEQEYNGYFRLTYAAFHCHAPACISGELWNRDTGELICRNTAEYGTGSEPLNETGYVVGIPPCVWGSPEEGLLPPPILHLDSNLTTIKRGNNTNGHWGVMSLWQCRAAYLENNSSVLGAH